MNKLEIPELPGFNVEEGICRLTETELLEWICHLRPTYPHCKGPGNIPFTASVRKKIVKGAPTSLKSSVIALLYRPDLTGGIEVTELEILNAMGVIASWGGRIQVAAPYCQRQSGCGYHNGQLSQSSNQNSLTCRDL